MSKSLEDLRQNAAKGIETCWVVERDFGTSKQTENRYLSWDPCTETGVVWDCHWDNALKFYDRASCERMCVEMPFEWKVSIQEHMIVFPLGDVKP